MASKPPPSLGPPAGVPASGNGKYVALAVLLLGGVGALIAWKSCQTPVEPVVVNVPVDAAPPPKRDLDDEIPLPPPIEDSGPDAAKPKVVHTGLASQCDAKVCKGSATDEVRKALSFRATQSRRCYNNALAQDSTLRGKVSLAVRVGANGSVCSARVESNDMGTDTVANCVVGFFRGQHMPQPKGGCIDVNVPINFVPGN
jgi:hypothetical protein